jgi:3-deoxy-D-manno-octulosonate cytidylyltransferase
VTHNSPQQHLQGEALSTVAILPARLGSTRLAKKVLLAETGLPLFVHSARNVTRCSAIGRVLVATDSEEVQRAGREHDIEVVMTRADHPSGSDRVREALDALDDASIDVVLNVQADEPDVDPEDLLRLVQSFEDRAQQIATLAARITGEGEHANPNVVKVVCDAGGRALYFSRAAIPSNAHAREGAVGIACARRHIGVYAFRPDSLRRFCDLGPSTLEAQENLEQLRWLEAGEPIRVLDTEHPPSGIDTRADYDAFVRSQQQS